MMSTQPPDNAPIKVKDLPGRIRKDTELVPPPRRDTDGMPHWFTVLQIRLGGEVTAEDLLKVQPW